MNHRPAACKPSPDQQLLCLCALVVVATWAVPACGTGRTCHENVCSGLAVNLLLAQNSANGNSNAAADNHDDRQFDANDGGNASGFSGWASDSSVESSSDESEKFERNERQRVQHAKELVDAAISTFEAYGSDKCTFDFADYIIRRSLGVRGGTELMGLLHRHGINHGKGLHEKCSTYSKLNSIRS